MQNIQSSGGATVKTILNNFNVRMKIPQIIYAYHEYFVENNTDQPQLFEIDYKVCAIDQCREDIFHIQVNPGGRSSNHSLQFVTFQIDTSGVYQSFASSDLRGIYHDYKEVRGTLNVS